jgi:hypothetical protein
MAMLSASIWTSCCLEKAATRDSGCPLPATAELCPPYGPAESASNTIRFDYTTRAQRGAGCVDPSSAVTSPDSVGGAGPSHRDRLAGEKDAEFGVLSVTGWTRYDPLRLKQARPDSANHCGEFGKAEVGRRTNAGMNAARMLGMIP